MTLPNLYIENFRIFKEVKIEKFNRVNLIVGKNNTGKSCLLEAIGVYNSYGDPRFLMQIIDYREELWSTSEESFENIFESHPTRHLFFGHKIPQLNKKGITIGPLDNSRNQIKLHPRAYQKVESESGEFVKKLVTQNDLFKKDLFDYDLYLEMEKGGRKEISIRLDEDFPRSFRRFAYSLQNLKYKSKSQFVPANGLKADEVSNLWDIIALTDLEDDVVEALRIIEKNVSSVTFVIDKVSSARIRTRIPIIKLNNSNIRVSLKSMGDGMTRIFDIILSLVNSKNGVLLIDEFENGLHWSVHSKMWNIVFELADKLNVQVFVTTHSKDCVDGYIEIWEKFEGRASFHRLEKDEDGDIKVFSYNKETLYDAIETETEVR